LYLLYLDDSGDAKDPTQHHVVLGGISLFERQVYWLAQRLESLAAEVSPHDPSLIEFHAYDIFHGRRPPWQGMSLSQRLDILRRVLAASREIGGSVSLFACAVEKASFPNDDPLELAFEDLCNRFDLQLKRLYAKGDPQRGMMILDKGSYETSLQRLARGFRTLGTRWGVIKNMADTPMFVDSIASRAIQVADHIAYAVFRRFEASDARLFDVIAADFDSEAGKLHGLVHKQTSNPRCMCPACMGRRGGMP
jgi:hypothetical protein